MSMFQNVHCNADSLPPEVLGWWAWRGAQECALWMRTPTCLMLMLRGCTGETQTWTGHPLRAPIAAVPAPALRPGLFLPASCLQTWWRGPIPDSWPNTIPGDFGIPSDRCGFQSVLLRPFSSLLPHHLTVLSFKLCPECSCFDTLFVLIHPPVSSGKRLLVLMWDSRASVLQAKAPGGSWSPHASHTTETGTAGSQDPLRSAPRGSPLTLGWSGVKVGLGLQMGCPPGCFLALG